MHCLNPSYDNAVILPPYNTVWAQVIKRGNPPQIVTTGVTVEYSIDGNTYSYGKRNYGQFWDNMLKLFGVSLPHDKGLNLDNPAINNGLSGTMVMKADHFQVNGIPVTPVNDSGTWNPFQVAIITVKDQTRGRARRHARDRADVGRDQLRQVSWQCDDRSSARYPAET